MPYSAIRFVTEVGHITDDKRQEFILLSDTLGLSTLAITAQNNVKPLGCTEATVFGPFFVENALGYQNGGDIANGARGEPCFVSGTVRSIEGGKVAGAQLSVWQSDEEGFYDVQRPELAAHQARGNLVSERDGSFHFKTILAAPYPIPHDGPVGAMLEQLGRHPWRPAHLHFMIKRSGFQTLITHIFRAGDPYLDSDAVFGVRSSLVTNWIRSRARARPRRVVSSTIRSVNGKASGPTNLTICDKRLSSLNNSMARLRIPSELCQSFRATNQQHRQRTHYNYPTS